MMMMMMMVMMVPMMVPMMVMMMTMMLMVRMMMVVLTFCPSIMYSCPTCVVSYGCHLSQLSRGLKPNLEVYKGCIVSCHKAGHYRQVRRATTCVVALFHTS